MTLDRLKITRKIIHPFCWRPQQLSGVWTFLTNISKARNSVSTQTISHWRKWDTFIQKQWTDYRRHCWNMIFSSSTRKAKSCWLTTSPDYLLQIHCWNHPMFWSVPTRPHRTSKSRCQSSKNESLQSTQTMGSKCSKIQSKISSKFGHYTVPRGTQCSLDQARWLQIPSHSPVPPRKIPQNGIVQSTSSPIWRL